MTNVLEWIKGNVFTVIFVVVMLGAVVTLPILAIGMNEGVKKQAEERAGYENQLKKIGVQVEYLDPLANVAISQKAVVNKPLVDRYRDIIGVRNEEGAEVKQLALAHNRKERGVLLPSLFPEPPFEDRDVLPERFGTLITRAYDSLFQEIRAGRPPTAASLTEDLTRTRAQFLDNEVNKRSVADLDPVELDSLREQLTNTRLQMYAEAAKDTAIYVDPGAVAVPTFDALAIPSLSTLFNWQWDLWIAEDVLRAIHGANADYESVVQAPVKRIYRVDIASLSTAKEESGGGNSGFGRGKPKKGEEAAPVAAVNYDALLTQKITPDYSATFTGRVTNKLYDVRRVEVAMVVDSTRIPEVIDAISGQNFITVVDLAVTTLDPFQHIADGYTYGQSPTVNLFLTLETLWLRQWTAEFMPTELKKGLGIPIPTAPATPAG